MGGLLGLMVRSVLLKELSNNRAMGSVLLKDLSNNRAMGFMSRVNGEVRWCIGGVVATRGFIMDARSLLAFPLHGGTFAGSYIGPHVSDFGPNIVSDRTAREALLSASRAVRSETRPNNERAHDVLGHHQRSPAFRTPRARSGVHEMPKAHCPCCGRKLALNRLDRHWIFAAGGSYSVSYRI